MMLKNILLAISLAFSGSAIAQTDAQSLSAKNNHAHVQQDNTDEIKVFASRLLREGESLRKYKKTSKKLSKRYKKVQSRLKQVRKGKRNKKFALTLKKDAKSLHKAARRDLKKYSKKRKKQYESYVNGVIGLSKLIRKKK